ncbi:hypothetical protein ANANG_G00220340 [Anguilla anguilla]|uniref:Uncharacterized protein n=1 Tax=Anguilla anguilla TaxID=7936 RepID=A0A9D3LW69_ANGAN|nr:hypothetical protein ANANG_G00220340 [Anguilla anguilla]
MRSSVGLTLAFPPRYQQWCSQANHTGILPPPPLWKLTMWHCSYQCRNQFVSACHPLASDAAVRFYAKTSFLGTGVLEFPFYRERSSHKGLVKLSLP